MKTEKVTADLAITAFQNLLTDRVGSQRTKTSVWTFLARVFVLGAGGFDRLVKTMVLEGVAGVAPMTWAGKSRPEKEIEAHLGPETSNLLKSGPNIYTDVKRTVERFLPSNASVTADDLMQQAIMGLNINNKQTRDYLFYAVGKRVPKDKVLKGTLDWRSDVSGMAKGFMKNRVRDVMNSLRKERSRTAPKVRRTDEGVQEVELPSFSDLSSENQMTLALSLLSDRGNSSLRPVQDWMAKKIKQFGVKSPTNAKIFEALLDNIERGSPKTETQIAGELGYTLHGKPQPARIWKAKKALGKFLAEELGKNPRVLDRIWKLIELSKLDFGVNPLGRQAKVGHLIWSYLTQNPDPRI